MKIGKCANRDSKDQKCKYNHPIVCSYFLKGSCKKGKDCDMMHWDTQNGKGERPKYDHKKGKGKGRNRSSSNYAVGNSPRRPFKPRTQKRNDKRNDRYTVKRTTKLTEFKSKKRLDSKNRGVSARAVVATLAIAAQVADA